MPRLPINPVIPDPWLGVQSISASGSTDVDYRLGRYVRLTLNGSITLGLIGWPVAGTVGRFNFEIYNTGAFGITWPAGVLWAGGAAPIPTSGSGKKDVVIFHSTDAGTNIFAYVVGQNFF